MRIWKGITAVGAAVIGFGILFFLQGNSIVGPSSSFMYSNPRWIQYGMYVAATGGIIVVAGIVVSLRRPKS